MSDRERVEPAESEKPQPNSEARPVEAVAPKPPGRFQLDDYYTDAFGSTLDDCMGLCCR